jgi:hypothetical protein
MNMQSLHAVDWIEQGLLQPSVRFERRLNLIESGIMIIRICRFMLRARHDFYTDELLTSDQSRTIPLLCISFG